VSVLTGAVAEDLVTIRATFDEPMDPATITGAAAWAVTLKTGPGADVEVVDAVPDTGDTEAVITVHPELTAGAEYDIQAVTAEAADDAAPPVPDTVSHTVSTGLAQTSDEFPHGAFESLTQAIGEEFQVFNGEPRTRLVDNAGPDDDVYFLESTLAWPTEGGFWAGVFRHTFTGRTDGSVTGVVPDQPRLRSISRGTEVVLDVAAILPS
jgi:hypothetical protein